MFLEQRLQRLAFAVRVGLFKNGLCPVSGRFFPLPPGTAALSGEPVHCHISLSSQLKHRTNASEKLNHISKRDISYLSGTFYDAAGLWADCFGRSDVGKPNAFLNSREKLAGFL